jgi:hypothetical protein
VDEPSQVGVEMRPLTLPRFGGTIAAEITRGVLTAIGGLIAVAILVLLASFVVSILF